MILNINYTPRSQLALCPYLDYRVKEFNIIINIRQIQYDIRLLNTENKIVLYLT